MNSKELRIVVTGGRNFTDRNYLYSTLDQWNKGFTRIIEVAHGACGCDGGVNPVRWNKMKGADLYAHLWAKMRGVPVTPFPANWTLYGPSAGPVRNRLMLETFKPDIVFGFAGGRGTGDCLAQARHLQLGIMYIMYCFDNDDPNSPPF